MLKVQVENKHSKIETNYQYNFLKITTSNPYLLFLTFKLFICTP